MNVPAAPDAAHPAQPRPQRRAVMAAAASWLALAAWSPARAQSRSNVLEFRGQVLLNGRRLQAQDTVQTGDEVATGPGGQVAFIIGSSAFLLRPQTRVFVERGSGLYTVSLVRLLSGGLVSVFGAGQRAISTPTLTARIEGPAGAYTEVMDDQGGRTYYCNAWGRAEVNRGPERVFSEATYHQCFWGEPVARNGHHIRPATVFNVRDDELETLARLVGQRTGWQLAGRKGVRDGKGYLDEQPGRPHPALAARPG